MLWIISTVTVEEHTKPIALLSTVPLLPDRIADLDERSNFDDRRSGHPLFSDRWLRHLMTH